MNERTQSATGAAEEGSDANLDKRPFPPFLLTPLSLLSLSLRSPPSPPLPLPHMPPGKRCRNQSRGWRAKNRRKSPAMNTIYIYIYIYGSKGSNV